MFCGGSKIDGDTSGFGDSAVLTKIFFVHTDDITLIILCLKFFLFDQLISFTSKLQNPIIL
jgi:hypothetical protein